MADQPLTIDIEILWKKVHTALTPEEEVRLDQWLQDDAHRRYFEEITQRWASAGLRNKHTLDTSLAWQKVARQTQGNYSRRRRLRYAMGIAASFLLFAVGVYFWPGAPAEAPVAVQQAAPVIPPGTHRAVLVTDDGNTYDLSAKTNLDLQTGSTHVSSQGTSLAYTATETASEPVSYHTLKIPRGGEFQLTLPDQTRVWLNSETTLRFPTRFAAGHRQVELSGEAYFEVAKNADKPFRILSGSQVTEVLGTSFNVASYENDSLVYTTLVEGKVAVSLRDQPDTRQILQPSHQSLLSKQQGTIAQRVVDTDAYVAWQQGRFYFKEQPLEEIMKTFARWYDVDVQFLNESARAYHFTGNLERYENFENILELLQATGEVKFKTAGRAITVE